MTLLQLKYALTIAEAGSMNRAAAILFLSQPTLTNAVRELEEEIGFTIFNRTSKGVTITPEGSDFLQQAHQVTQQYDLLQEKYHGNKNIRRHFGVSTQHYSFVDKAFVEMVRRLDTLQFDFAIRETRTEQVILDVGELRSEIGVLYQSDYNRQIIERMLKEHQLEFHHLIECRAYVYLWSKHPLAHKKSISWAELEDYPCLSFEQGSQASPFLAEEILTEKEYPRRIRATDRATILNLMVGLNGYTLCSGIICEELNGTDYVAIPYEEDDDYQNCRMEIGYIQKKGFSLSEIGQELIREMKKYLSAYQHHQES